MGWPFMIITNIKSKHKREGKNAGYTLIGAGKNKDYRTYRCDKCKYLSEYQPTHIRKKNVRCANCYLEQLKSEAKKASFNLLDAGTDPERRLYECVVCKAERELYTASVRNGEVRCQTCLEQRLETEASKKRFTIVGKGRAAEYRLYSCIECGHQQERQTPDVRVGNIACESCSIGILEADAREKELTLIGECGQDGYRLYQFDSCGHEQALQMSHVREGRFECKQCLQEKHEAEAINVGLTLIGKGSKPKFRKYQFVDCEHEKEIEPGDVRDGTFKCAICFDNKLVQEAGKFGLTLIGAGRNANYRLYSFDECGHERALYTSAVRKNSFICDTCEEVSRDLPSNIYLAQIKVGSSKWIKVGYAKNPEDRIKRYGLPSRAIFLGMLVIPEKTGREAEKFERGLHRRLRAKRFSPERMKRYHRLSGFDECYPIKMLDSLLAELETRARLTSVPIENYSTDKLPTLLTLT
jgi:hypothetical protein